MIIAQKIKLANRSHFTVLFTISVKGISFDIFSEICHLWFRFPCSIFYLFFNFFFKICPSLDELTKNSTENFFHFLLNISYSRFISLLFFAWNLCLLETTLFIPLPAMDFQPFIQFRLPVVFFSIFIFAQNIFAGNFSVFHKEYPVTATGNSAVMGYKQNTHPFPVQSYKLFHDFF